MTLAHDLQAAAWDAECRRDVDAVLRHFHSEATFRPAGAPARRGHAAIRELTETFYRAYADLQIDILNEWNRGDSSAVFEFRARLVDNDGNHSTLDGVCLVDIEDGAFTAVRYYEDAPVPATS